MTVAGFFDDRSSERLGGINGDTVLGKLQDLPGYLKSAGADVIFIALPMRNISRVSELLNELHDTTASIYYVPDVFVFDLIQCRTGDIDGMPVVALCETPFYGTRGVVKRVSDFVIATLALVALSPLIPGHRSRHQARPRPARSSSSNDATASMARRSWSTSSAP